MIGDDAWGVWADALIEAGDPRGEQIHVTRELARLGIGSIEELVESNLEGEELARVAALLKIPKYETTVSTSRPEELAEAFASGPIDGWRISDRSAPLHGFLELPLERIRRFDSSELRAHRCTKELLGKMPKLRALAIFGVDDFDIEWLAQCPELEELTIGELAEGDRERLGELPFASRLKRLDLRGYEFPLLAGFTALETLHLQGVPSDLATARLPKEIHLQGGKAIAPLVATHRSRRSSGSR
jgi:hypothetical protein